MHLCALELRRIQPTFTLFSYSAPPSHHGILLTSSRLFSPQVPQLFRVCDVGHRLCYECALELPSGQCLRVSLTPLYLG